jgi:hypothetical protein
MSSEVQNGFSLINSKVDALNTQKQLSEDIKQLEKSKGNSLEESAANVANQLNKVKEQARSFQRNIPTSMDQLVNLIGKTKGNSSQTFQYLRRKVLEAMVKMEPKVQEIVITETIKTLGCSQEQSYQAISLPLSTIPPIQQIQTLPVSQGLYVPVNSIDFMGNLKIGIDSPIGSFFYEKPQPSTDTSLKPYGGKTSYPFNKMLNLRTNQAGRTYGTEFGQFYNGVSQQNLFDITYTQQNDLGVNGDFFRIFLLDRNGSQSNTFQFKNNKVGEFLKDYYSTIRIVDPVSVAGAVMNYASNFISIKGQFSYKRLSDDTKFERIITRILGLCNDSRKEIDISGLAKISEYDGVDDSFFEFNDVDLRNIEDKIANIQKGIVKFESCDDVELPVNTDTLVDEFAEFRNLISGQTPQQTVKSIEKIVDTFAENPDWKPLIPNGVKVDIEINKNIIKDLPKAVASGVLTPKVLLPIFILLQSIEQGAKNKVNQQILTANTVIQQSNTLINSANTFSQQALQTGTTFGQIVDNIIDDVVDFLKKFKEFVFEVVKKINEIFLKELFEILKKDILNLLNVLIGDIQKSQRLKKYTIILRLIQLTLIVVQIIQDYKKCKSLVDGILNLLRLINSSFGGGNAIPTALLFLTPLLPGTSPERASLNIIEGMQKLGLPTGPMPDGSPNIMNVFMDAMVRGMDKEESENGTIDAVAIVPPLAGGLIKVFAKKR